MTINDKLVQARDIFMATHNDIMEGRKTPVPGSDKYVVSDAILISVNWVLLILSNDDVSPKIKAYKLSKLL